MDPQTSWFVSPLVIVALSIRPRRTRHGLDQISEAQDGSGATRPALAGDDRGSASLCRQETETTARHVRGLFFLIHDGRSWDNSMNPIARYFRQCYQRAGIKDGGFYWARHTFATIASGSRDQVAVNAIMGHVDPTMAANYREHIDEARLKAVVEHVRSWLFW